MGCAVNGKSSDKRVDEDIQTLSEIVSRLDDVSTVAVNKRRLIGGHNVTLFQHIGPFFEIADPKIVGMFPAPTFANFTADNAQLHTGGTGLFEMTVKGGARHGYPVHLFQETIDGCGRATGLFFFQFNGLVYHLNRDVSRRPLIPTLFPRQGIKAAIEVSLQLAAQRLNRGLADSSVRELNLFFCL